MAIDEVDKASGGYADRLVANNSVDYNPADLVQQLVELEKQSVDLRNKRTEVQESSPLERLGSLPGILTLLAGGGAAAFGGQGGANVGAALIGGAVHGAREAKVVDEQRLNQRIQETQSIVDDQRTRLVTMLQSRPEMFLDPTTGKSLVDPRALGYAATGYLLPIDPGVNYALTKQSQMREAQISIGINLATSGDTAEKREQGLVILGNTIGVPFDDSIKNAIQTGDETQMWTAIAGSPDFDARMTLQAWHWALNNRKPDGSPYTLRDPEVVGQLMPAAKERLEPAGPKFTLDDYTLDVLGEYQQAIQGVPGAESMTLEQRVDYVFGNDIAKADLLKKYFVGNNVFDTGLSGSMIMQSITNTAGQLAQLYAMSPTAAAALGVTSPEDIIKRAYAITQEAIPRLVEGVNATVAQDQGYSMRRMEEAIMMAYPDTDPFQATTIAAQQMAAIREAATKNGYVDNAAFTAGVAAYIKNPTLPGGTQ